MWRRVRPILMSDSQRNSSSSESAQKASPPDVSSGRGRGIPQGHRYPNPPETVNPDAATLREQWRFAIRQYSKWYSHAWGTAIIAGLSFFALGWVIKGSNPLPSRKSVDRDLGAPSSSTGVGDERESPVNPSVWSTGLFLKYPGKTDQAICFVPLPDPCFSYVSAASYFQIIWFCILQEF